MKNKKFIYKKCFGAKRQNRKIKFKFILFLLVATFIAGGVAYAGRWYDSVLGDLDLEWRTQDLINNPVSASTIISSKELITQIIKENNHSIYKDDYLIQIITDCENKSLNVDAVNPIITSTGNAMGLAQFTILTWMEGVKRFEPTWKNADIFDQEKSIIMMMHFVNANEIWRWECQ